MTAYQVICAIREGKRIFRVKKGDDIRFIWAFSLENAKSKFPKWDVSEYATVSFALKEK